MAEPQKPYKHYNTFSNVFKAVGGMLPESTLQLLYLLDGKACCFSNLLANQSPIANRFRATARAFAISPRFAAA